MNQPSSSQPFTDFSAHPCGYLLALAGWAQNRSLDVEGVVKGRGFDSHRSLFFTLSRLTDRLFTEQSLGFERHLELALG